MARVLNLIRRSEAVFVIEEEVRPGQWVTATHVPQAAFTPAKPRQAFVTPADVANFFDSIGSFFSRGLTRISPAQAAAAAPSPPEPVVEEPPPPPRPLAQGPLRGQPALGVTPEQITRLVTETKIREQQIKNFVAQPIGFVWQESKKLPDRLERVPVRRPTPTPEEIAARFPLPTIPTPQEVAGFGPAPVRVFKGFLQLEGGRRINLWEDFAGNEVEGFREQPGEFGQTQEILEY